MNEKLMSVLARLREERSKPHYSEDISAPKLSTLLAIYNKSSHVCYINYMEGFKKLVDWLTNERTVPVDLEPDKFPRQLDPNFRPSPLIGSYEVLQIAKIVTFTPENDPYHLIHLGYAYKAILLYLIKETEDDVTI